jgi:Calx-beta domain/FG-GAP-like repeat
VGDFNGDGKPDLVIGTGLGGAGDFYDGAIAVLLGNGDGSFQYVNTFLTGGEAAQGVAVADFDADGKLDVAVTGNSGFEYGGDVAVLLGRGDGTFATPSGTHHLAGAFSVATGDFNRDGRVDLAWAASSAVGVFWGNGDGTFAAAAQFFATDADSISVNVADLNGDGKPDLVTGNSNGSGSVLLGNGDGSFQAVRNYSGAGAVVGDFNGDGSLDLAVGTSLLPGNGNDAGTFGPAASGFAFLDQPAAVGDFNGDGRWDMAAANYWANSVSVLLNDGIWDGPPPLPPSPPSMRIDDVTVTEGNTGTVAATFTVTLSAASTGAITVAYSTGNGTATAGGDYTAASGNVTIPAGQLSRTFTVVVKGDRLAEPNETFFVNLSSPTNASIADGRGVGTILDDEPRISIRDASKSEGRKGKTTLFSFTVTLSTAYDQPVTLSYRTVNGTATTGNNDYTAKTGTLTFAPGETTKTISIEVKGDNKHESTEYFYLDLFGNSSNSLFTKNRGVGAILNDD